MKYPDDKMIDRMIDLEARVRLLEYQQTNNKTQHITQVTEVIERAPVKVKHEEATEEKTEEPTEDKPKEQTEEEKKDKTIEESIINEDPKKFNFLVSLEKMVLTKLVGPILPVVAGAAIYFFNAYLGLPK